MSSFTITLIITIVMVICISIIVVSNIKSKLEKKFNSEKDYIESTCNSSVQKAQKNCQQKILEYQKEMEQHLENYNKIHDMLKQLESNLTAIPYMAGMIADIETYGLEKLALGLSWGYAQKRLDKVKSIREIRADAQAMVERNKYSHYQLNYLLDLFPSLKDIVECDYNDLPKIEVSELSDYDYSRNYLSKEEYESLSSVERNQLALDRYLSSHSKTKWQIGRDYEQYVGYKFRKIGYHVDDCGSYLGLKDLGRDIIAKRGNSTLIVQCKYWSNIKQIHEKHITQLYGTTISYCIEKQIDKSKVTGVLVTNIRLSETAKKIADYLGIEYVENYPMGPYPCIKCNIGHDGFGETKIYHLPFDQKYDETKINKKGEFYAMTVAEAENAGFRRSYKWYGH